MLGADYNLQVPIRAYSLLFLMCSSLLFTSISSPAGWKTFCRTVTLTDIITVVSGWGCFHTLQASRKIEGVNFAAR